MDNKNKFGENAPSRYSIKIQDKGFNLRIYGFNGTYLGWTRIGSVFDTASSNSEMGRNHSYPTKVLVCSLYSRVAMKWFA